MFQTSNTQVHLGEWRQTVRGKQLTEQPSSLSVWDRTSDYSSHLNRLSKNLTDTKPKNFPTSKPCFV